MCNHHNVIYYMYKAMIIFEKEIAKYKCLLLRLKLYLERQEIYKLIKLVILFCENVRKA